MTTVEKIKKAKEYRKLMEQPGIDPQTKYQYQAKAIAWETEAEQDLIDEGQQEYEEEHGLIDEDDDMENNGKIWPEDDYGQTAYGDNRGDDEDDDSLEGDQPDSPFQKPFLRDDD